MYTVSILSQSTRQWRSIQVKTLSECVQLTLGLSTAFRVECDGCIVAYKQTNMNWECKKYQHALRALVQRWKRNDPSPVCWFRFSDSVLLKAHKAFAEGWVLVLDELDN